MGLIDKAAIVAEMKRRIFNLEQLGDRKFIETHFPEQFRFIEIYEGIVDFINALKVKEVDLEKESELIANGIMIGVQANKYGTNIYNTKRNDFNHYHLQMAARKGIELGLKAQKGE